MTLICDDASERMERAVAHTRSDLASIRTGRASPALVEKLPVDYYGSIVPLQQLASFSVPDARMLVVTPFDKGSMGAVERAIQESNLGLNPSNDGVNIRLAFPQLTEERRKELAKQVKKYGEEAKVAVRNIRRDAIEKFKKQQKASEITEDDYKNVEKEVQKLTDDYVKKVDDITDNKDKELLAI